MRSDTSKATNWLRNAAVPASGWHALRYQWGKDAQLGLFIFATLALFRLLLVAVFHDRAAADSGLVDLLPVLANGVRYDLSTAAIWVLPTFLVTLGAPVLHYCRGLLVLRRFVGRLFVWIAVPLFGADLVFFHEYNDQFNQHVFGLVNDDTQAILITLWKSYHPLLFAAIALPLLFLGDRAVRAWLQWTPHWLNERRRHTRLHALLAGLGVLLLFVAAARGGTLWGEPIRLKHAFVARDLFLNRVVLNPFTALRETLQAKWQSSRGTGLATLWPDGDIRSAVAAFRGPGPVTDLDAALATPARGNDRPPRHVFVLLLESQNGWPLLPEYRSLGFAPKLSALSNKGLYFPRFLPVATGTVGALHALMLGMPDSGLDVNYETRTLKPYATSVAATFRQLGYRTRFFYGGFLGWQRLDTYAQAQGFDEVYGGGDMSAGENTNEWGVRDAALYDFVLRRVDDSEPSFNFILTTSNHPPYDIDLAREGFPFQTLPEPLQATKGDTLKILGHGWYADREAGRFVEGMEHSVPRPLFAITGDHTDRLQVRFPGDGLFEQVAVPLILYGPEVLDGRSGLQNVAGNHIDLPPTLFELAAPAGFTYHAFGESLLHKQAPSYGFGYELVATERSIASQADPSQAFRLPGAAETPTADPALPAAVERFRAARALAWYRVKEGSQLPRE